jgi:hypothetical protein
MSSSEYSDSSFSDIEVCCDFSCVGESPLEPGGWTAPEVIPSVSSEGRRWGVVGVGGTTTSEDSVVAGTFCTEVSTVGFEDSGFGTSSGTPCCISGDFRGGFSCGRGVMGWGVSGNSMGCAAGEGKTQGTIIRKNLDKKEEREGCGWPWPFGFDFFVGEGIPTRVEVC